MWRLCKWYHKLWMCSLVLVGGLSSMLLLRIHSREISIMHVTSAVYWELWHFSCTYTVSSVFVVTFVTGLLDYHCYFAYEFCLTRNIYIVYLWVNLPDNAYCCSFYRTTHMHSADYVVPRCLSVCLSVRLSVTRRYSIWTVTHILKNFSLAGSPIILVFLHQTEWQGRRRMQGGYKKILIFDQYLALSRKWSEIEP